MKYSDITRRQLAADTAQPSPRGTGRKITLEITLYEGGHSAIFSVPRTQPMLSRDHADLMLQLDLLLRNVRERLVPQRLLTHQENPPGTIPYLRPSAA